jgi:hypothetical protein
MSHSALYDDDILLWSEQQAEIIRRLGRSRPNLPNEFDVENVAEEIESVGRSELAAVESLLQNILLHLMKLAIHPEAVAVRHWRVEAAAFHGEVRRRYVPSMRPRIDLGQLWALARELAILGADEPEAVEIALSKHPPFPLDSLLAERLDSAALAQAIRFAITNKKE